MKNKEIKIEGMSCSHCVAAVKKSLEKVESLRVEDVKIGSAKIEFDESKVSNNKIIEAIEGAGYKVIPN